MMLQTEPFCTQAPPTSAALKRGLIVAALALGLVLRLVGLSSPPFDNHSFRQTQTLSTIEAYHADGIDLLHPRALYTGYPGTFVLELPVFQAAAALLYDLFGQHLEIVRLFNIVFGLLATWLLYRLTAYLLNSPTAILAALVYWLAPLNIIYQRAVLLDPSAVCAALLSFYSLARFLDPYGLADSSQATGGRWLWFTTFAVSTWLTAMMKGLYLWPTVLLLAQAVSLRRFRLDSALLSVIGLFAFAGICFIAWNHFSTEVNNGSPLTRGIKPTALLGFSALLQPGFYYEQLVRRPKRWLGLAGAVLYVIGLIGGWKDRPKCAGSTPFLLVLLIPPTYLIAFANINYPHDYYQVIITPFLAIVAGNGAWWLTRRVLAHATRPAHSVKWLLALGGGTFLLVALLCYVKWGPQVDQRVVNFQDYCAGRVKSGAPGMLFLARKAVGGAALWDAPQYLYAAKLWGYAKIVEDNAQARPLFNSALPGFSRLDYVVFYGTDCPNWLPTDQFSLTSRDDRHRLYVFERGSGHS